MRAYLTSLLRRIFGRPAPTPVDTPVLRVLRGALANIRTTTNFEFVNWSTCTVGQIYRAATGGVCPANESDRQREMVRLPAFRNALQVVTDANNLMGLTAVTIFRPVTSLDYAVSDGTAVYASRHYLTKQQAAERLVQNAIHDLEQVTV